MPSISSTSGSVKTERLLADVLTALKENHAPLDDTLERVQQQLGQINNGNNLAPGERLK